MFGSFEKEIMDSLIGTTPREKHESLKNTLDLVEQLRIENSQLKELCEMYVKIYDENNFCMYPSDYRSLIELRNEIKTRGNDISKSKDIK